MSLLDFDEMLVSIKNTQVKKYLEEAIKSYRIGNYRSAIITVWIATMFDLVKKFEVLVEQREPTAIQKWNDLKPKIEDHNNWEKELIDAAQAAAMISRYEADSLRALNKTRNRYAHPSFDEVGALFDPTPEEVRYFVRTLYDSVLSQPAQLGAFYVKQLLENIKNPTFFATKLFVEELVSVKDLAIEKFNRINKKQLGRLLKELFAALLAPSSDDHELNILCFVINLWGCQDELQDPAMISHNLNEYIVNQGLSDRLLEAVLNYPERIPQLSVQSQQQIEAALKKPEILLRPKYRESLRRLFAASDVLPLTQTLLSYVKTQVPIAEVIKRRSHFAEVLDNQFSQVFGPASTLR